MLFGPSSRPWSGPHAGRDEAAMDPILLGVGWLLSQSQIISYVVSRLLDRFVPSRRNAPLPQVEMAVPMGQLPVAAGPDRISDRLIVPLPGRLLFVREKPGPSEPVLAVVLSDGPSSGRVLWILGRFDVPIELELPENAIALLPLMMWIDGPGQGRITPHDFQFTGTVDGYQVYAAA